MLALFTIVLAFCGFFADDLKHHESKSDNLYWFHPKNIINFPLHQLKHNVQKDYIEYWDNDTVPMPIIPDVIDTLYIQPFEEPVHYIFVVDKTISAQANLQQDIEDFKRITNGRIGFDVSAKNNKFIDREDFMLACCIDKILKEDPKCTYQVFVYNGEKLTMSERQNDKFEFEEIIENKNRNIEYFITNYKYREYNDRQSRNTNFVSIANKILESLPPCATNKNKSVTVFSDFEHEDDVTENFAQLDSAIGALKENLMTPNKKNEPSILMNLVKLSSGKSKFLHNLSPITPTSWSLNPYSFEHKDDNELFHSVALTGNVENHISITINAEKIDKENKIEQTLNAFRKHFHFEYQYIYNEFEILVKESITDILSHIVTFIRKDKVHYKHWSKRDSISCLTFYYPFSIGKMDQLHSAFVKFDTKDKDTIYRNLIFCASDNSINHAEFLMRLHDTVNDDKKELILTNGEPEEFYIDFSHIYQVDIDVDKIPHNMVMDISFQNNKDSTTTIKEQVQIQFKTLLPKFLCYLIILAIILFFILLATLFFYFCYKLAICKYACGSYCDKNK
jgi:hypothetical protein